MADAIAILKLYVPLWLILSIVNFIFHVVPLYVLFSFFLQSKNDHGCMNQHYLSKFEKHVKSRLCGVTSTKIDQVTLTANGFHGFWKVRLIASVSWKVK